MGLVVTAVVCVGVQADCRGGWQKAVVAVVAVGGLWAYCMGG